MIDIIIYYIVIFFSGFLALIIILLGLLGIVGFYQNTIDPMVEMIRHTRHTRRLTRADVIAENEKIKLENEKYRTDNPLNIEWLEYRDGIPVMMYYCQYIEWGTPVHWKIPEGMSIASKLEGFWRSTRRLTSREVLQLAQGIHFPRTYEEAKKEWKEL